MVCVMNFQLDPYPAMAMDGIRRLSWATDKLTELPC